MPLKVEIVTPVHNRREETLECLRSIAESDSTGLQLHVIVVDDGSTDGTAEAIEQQFPEVEIVRGDGSLWYTAGTNRGISAALKHEPDYILAINNDQVFDEKCIVNLVNYAERHPRSVVGGLLLNRETPDKVFQVSPRWELWNGGYRHWYKQTIETIPDRPWEVEIIVGNCVLYPAAAVREVGLMDERRLPQFGDAEYTPRMRRAGWQLLIEPRARVYCKPNDVITGFRHLPLAKQFRLLFTDPHSGYSLRRRFYSSFLGAPDRLQGLLAFPIAVARILAGRSYDSTWAMTQDEPPLYETFASAIRDD